MSEEAVGPAGAISGLAADTSQKDPVALVQNMFAEGSFTSLVGKLREREKEEEGERGNGFLCSPIRMFNFFFLPLSLHTSAFPELHCRNS